MPRPSYATLPRLLGAVLLSVAGAVAFAQGSVDTNDDWQPEDRATIAELQRHADLPVPEDADAPSRCSALHKRGVANARLGHYEHAIADLREAYQLSPPGDRPGRVAAFGKTRRRAEPSSPTPVDSMPPSDFDASGQWCQRWRVEVDLVSAYQSYGDYFAAIEMTGSMASEWRPQNIRRYADVQLLMASSYVPLGMVDDAVQAFNRASEVLPDIKRRGDWAKLHDLVEGGFDATAGLLQEIHGSFAEAEKLRRSSLLSTERYLVQFAGPRDQRVVKRLVIQRTLALSSILQTQGKWGEAEYYADEALSKSLATYAFATLETSRALDNLAWIKQDRGELDDAARYEELALKAIAKSDVASYSPGLDERRARLGTIRNMQGRWKDAAEVFRLRAEGIRTYPDRDKRRGVRHIEWAMALIRTGHADEASAMLRGTIQYLVSRSFTPPLSLANARAYLGVALAQHGDDELALAYFREALPVLLQQMRDRADGTARGYLQIYRLRLILDAYLEVLGRLNRVDQVQQNGAEEAFRIADIARDSSVQQAVAFSVARAQLPDAELAELARREQDDANHIRVLTRLLEDAISGRQQSDQSMSSLREQLAKLSEEQTSLREEIARRYPDYARLINPQPATPADIRRVLRPGEALISIYSGERQTYVWTITPAGMNWRVLPVSSAALAHEVTHLRHTLDLADGGLKTYDVAAAHDLYERLLAPDAALWRDAATLVVVPHGALGELPFAVLLTEPVPPGAALDGNAYASMPWLIKRVAIVQQSSARSFVAQRTMRPANERRAPFIGFGDPLFTADAQRGAKRDGVRQLNVSAMEDVMQPLVTQAQQSAGSDEPAAPRRLPTLAQSFALLPELPDTADELTEIAGTLGANPQSDLYLGARASKANVKRVDLARYRVVAFATHGLKAGELAGLDQPALAMANPGLTHEPGDDGFLKLEDVFALRLDADWVILSACNTASPDGSSNEAVSGLGRGFFYAGARSVLVSNWAVESNSARLLTTGLFREQANHPEMMRPEALRRSMLGLMKEHAAEYGHPAFWGPFTLVGDGG